MVRANQAESRGLRIIIVFSYKCQFQTSDIHQSKNNQMKGKNKTVTEKGKKLQPTSFTFKKRKTVRPNFIWWGWKTAYT